MSNKLVKLKWITRLFFAIAIASLFFFSEVIIATAAYGSDVTSQTAYIESSHYSTFTGAFAFSNTSQEFYSGEQGAGVNGVSYVGQDFGASVHEIRRVGYYGFGASAYSITSYLLENSDDGINWAVCGEAVSVVVSIQEQFANFPECGSYRYWRILANSATGSSYWIVNEIEMFEYIEDPTPTVTVTPTITPTPTNTPLPMAYISTLSSGVPYEIERSATFGEIALFAILAFISVILLVGLFVRISTNANTNG